MHATEKVSETSPPIKLPSPFREEPMLSNNDFYLKFDDADRIMDPSYFPPEIVQFLHDEKVHLTRILAQEKYDCIVEVGCHSGHNAEWLAELCEHYVGIDINLVAIERALGARGQPGRIDFFCESVENLQQLLGSERKYFKRKLVLFPFNLFGNFTNNEELIGLLDMSGVDLAMSNFNVLAATTVGRYKYYSNCFGLERVRVYDAEQGVLFKVGNHFRSIAYRTTYLTKLVSDISRYHGVITPFSAYGNLILLSN